MNDLKYEWDSSVPRVQEQVDRLCVHPQPPDFQYMLQNFHKKLLNLMQENL